MKHIKKVVTLMLAFVMVFSMSVFTAFAANTTEHTITITNTDPAKQHTYEAYQVFSGDLDASEAKLANIDWGTGVNGSALLTALKADASPLKTDFASCTTPGDVAKVVATFKDGNASKLDAFAKIVGSNLATKADTSEETKSPYTLTVSGDGYYFVKDKDDSVTAEGETYTKYILNVVKNVSIEAKDDHLKPDKKIVAGEEKVAADSAAIGDVVTFEVSIPIPKMDGYNRFQFKMTDQLPAGLTFKEITSVKVGTKTLALTGENADVSTTITPTVAGTDLVAAAGGQKIEVLFKDFLNLVNNGGNKLTGNVVLQYKAVVNDDADYQTTGNKNEVKFDYSNNPSHEYDEDWDNGPHGQTVKVETYTYTTSIKLKKVDENNQPLAGATFKLSGDALNRTVITGDKFELPAYEAKPGETINTATKYWKLKDDSYTTTDPATLDNKTQYVDPNTFYYKVSINTAEVATQQTEITLTSGADGVIEFVGLNEGTYTLEEVSAPNGYNKINGTSTIKVNWSDPKADGAASPAKDQGGFTITADKFAENMAWNGTDKQFEVTIQNQSGTELPSTGGIGTVIFYVLGSLLVVGCGIVLISKRRMNSTK